MSEPTYLCPICKEPASREDQHFPFCSARCKTTDLGAWSAGEYVISRPVTEADEHYESLIEQSQQDEPHE